MQLLRRAGYRTPAWVQAAPRLDMASSLWSVPPEMLQGYYDPRLACRPRDGAVAGLPGAVCMPCTRRLESKLEQEPVGDVGPFRHSQARQLGIWNSVKMLWRPSRPIVNPCCTIVSEGFPNLRLVPLSPHSLSPCVWFVCVCVRGFVCVECKYRGLSPHQARSLCESLRPDMLMSLLPC